jgi:flagellar motor switch protein FliM
MWSTEIELEAVMDERTMKLKDVFDLSVGTRIMFEATPQSLIEIRCGHIPLYAAKMGRQSDRIAVQVERRIEKPGLGK